MNGQETVTPMMQQYLDLKRQHQHEVLFFRLGDFYEMFMDDAKQVSRILNITLTSRNGVPMCGIPHHAAKSYLKRLIEAGKKIAICEQIELPQDGRSIATREVVQIITPGTVIEDEFLEEQDTTFVFAAVLAGKDISCSWCSLTEGLFFMEVLRQDRNWESLRSLLAMVKPKEIVVNEDDHITDASFASVIDNLQVMTSRMPAWQCTVKHGYRSLKEHCDTVTLKQFGIAEHDTHLASAGALLGYVTATLKSSVAHVTNFLKIDRKDELQIDEASRKNLELVSNLEDGSKTRTLFSTIDMTKSSGGARLLKRWISAPLCDLEQIRDRQKEVKWFLDHAKELERVRDILGSILDVVRLSTRVSMRRCVPRDLVSISRSIAAFFIMVSIESEHYRTLFPDILTDEMLEQLLLLMEQLDAALNDQCNGPFTAGQTIRKGYDEQLDLLRDQHRTFNSNLNDYVEKIKEETKIPTVKLAYNKVIGHYIEIPKTHSAKVPSQFYRKQTLVNAERYTTEELSRMESELVASEDAAERLERQIFENLVERCAYLVNGFNAIAQFFSTVDCFQSLASVAKSYGYCMPEVTKEGILSIEEGRHPVVERHLPLGTFVANPLEMGNGNDRFCLITGPNMAGKSTYLRQNALIVVLAQIGSCVPARKARIPLIDKLFCRIGASDNLARGESTFLVEMQEAAFIIRTATDRSFVIMDEIGRGTSTQDGMSIAYAVMRYLVDKKIKTLFATHYHELTMLDTSDVELLTLEVAESNNRIIFLRKLIKGIADSSYGLHVAAMAGMPSNVLKIARQFQKRHFEDYGMRSDSVQFDLFKEHENGAVSAPETSKLAAMIANFNLEHSTPVQAMTFVEQLKEELGS